MTGNRPFEYKCPECEHLSQAVGKALSVAMTCQKCGQYFRIHSGYHDKFLNKFKPAIAIGAKGRIKGALYQVMGFAVKRERKYKYHWREYFLFSPIHGIAFLSESEGNWNFLKPYPKHPWSAGNTKEEPEIAHGAFALFSKYRAELVFAAGEFFSDVIETTEKTQHYEHINPPYVLTYEESNARTGAYLGEYLAPDKVAAAFNLKKTDLPAKESMGYTEPLAFSFDKQMLFTITAVALALVTVIAMFMNNATANKSIYTEYFNQAQMGAQKVFVTKSFSIPESGALEVRVWAPLSNDWFFAEYSLVNEATSEEIVFTNEFEYYSGMEGGYAWTEGSQRAEAFLSSIPAGKYHIAIYPEFSLTNHEFSVEVVYDVPFYSNYFLVVLALLVFPTIIYFYSHSKEITRWSASDYSPYSHD